MSVNEVSDEWKVIHAIYGANIFIIEHISPEQLLRLIPKFVLEVEKWNRLTGDMKKQLVISSLETLFKKFTNNEAEIAEANIIIARYVPIIIDGMVSVANSREFKAVFSKKCRCGK